MIKKFKFDYDYENDNLFLYRLNQKSKASIEINNLIIDYNSKKEICAFELLNASKFFKDISSKEIKISKKKLKELIESKVEIKKNNNFFTIKFLFVFKSKQELTAPIIIPTINKPSPAIA